MIDYKRQLNSKDSGVLIIFNFVMMLVVQFVIGIVIAIAAGGDLSNNALFLLLITNQLVFLVITFVYVRSRSVSPIKIAGFKNKLSTNQLLILPLISVLVLLSSGSIAQLFGLLTRALGYDPQVSFPSIDSLQTLLIAIFIIAVMPALGEEFLFRNAIMRGFKRRGYLFAAILSSVMFSLMHMNVDQLIHTFLFGLVLAYTMQVTNNLLAPIILHFINNLIAICLTFVLTDSMTANWNPVIFIVTLCAFVIVFGIALIMALKYFLKLEFEKRSNIIDIDPTNDFVSSYITTAKSIIRFIVSRNARREFKENYNLTMSELDYEKEDLLNNEQSEIMMLIEKNQDTMGFVKLAIIGMAFMTLISFGLGFISL